MPIWGKETEFLGHGVPTLTGSSFLREVARGNVTGAERWSGFGEAVLGSAQTWYDVSPLGVASIPSPAEAGVQMSVVSSSAADDSVSTGIRTVDIHYLDADGNEQSEVVPMDGTTPVLTTAINMRWIQCAHARSAGSGGVAAGDITISNGGTTYSVIKTGNTRCSSSARMVPAGKRLFVTDLACGVTSGTNAAAKFYIGANSQNGDLLTYPLFIPHVELILQETSIQLEFEIPMAYPALSVVKVKATTDKAATVAASWRGWYEAA